MGPLNPGNRWVVVGIVLVLSGCFSPNPPAAKSLAAEIPILPDITIPGVHQILRIEYDLGYMVAQSPPSGAAAAAPAGLPFPIALRGSVHYPTDAPGPYPVLVFMHGRHSTCAIQAFGETLGPVVCPRTPVTNPVDSFRGYDYLAEPLAKRGYVVIGVNANNVNDLDNSYPDYGQTVRAQLVMRTLDEFSKLNQTAGAEPVAGKLLGRLDLSRIGLMGHSRGGEGVTRAISYNEARTDGPKYAIKAVFALAPTDFFRWPAPNVAFATLIPYCDGDVSNLQGAQIYDDARYLDERTPSPKIQILAMGSNHNFYNTIWTGDDASFRYAQDPECKPGDTNPHRLSPDAQRRHGLVFMEAFFRLYIGGETALAPLFTAQAPVPEAACPARRTTCDALFHISFHAGAPGRLTVEDARDDRTLTGNDVGGVTKLEGFTNKTVCEPRACPTQPNLGAAGQLSLGWTGNATYRTTLPEAKRDISSFDVLTLRVGVAAGDPRNVQGVRQDFRIVLEDADGHRAGVHADAYDDATFYPPGRLARKVTLNMLAVPLADFGGANLAHVAAIELQFGVVPAGLVQLTDLQVQRLA